MSRNTVLSFFCLGVVFKLSCEVLCPDFIPEWMTVRSRTETLVVKVASRHVVFTTILCSKLQIPTWRRCRGLSIQYWHVIIIYILVLGIRMQFKDLHYRLNYAGSQNAFICSVDVSKSFIFLCTPICFRVVSCDFFYGAASISGLCDVHGRIR